MMCFFSKLNINKNNYKMTEFLKEWRVYCETEEVYHSVWLDSTTSAPTTCPINTNHKITSNLTHDISTHNLTERVMIEEEESGKTQGYFRTMGKTIDIDGNVDSVTQLTIVWPYKTTMLTGWFYSQENQVGDSVSAIVSPDTITGYITSDVTTGDNTANVSSTVIDNIAIGFDISLFNGVTKSHLGEVIGIENEMTLTTTGTSDISYSYTSPTYVIQSINLIDNLRINAPNVKFSFAEKKQRGKGIPANVPTVINYVNHSGGEKTFSFVIEYMY